MSYILDCEGLGELMSVTELKELIKNGITAENSDLRKLSIDKLSKKLEKEINQEGKPLNVKGKQPMEEIVLIDYEADQDLIILLIQTLLKKDFKRERKRSFKSSSR